MKRVVIGCHATIKRNTRIQKTNCTHTRQMNIPSVLNTDITNFINYQYLEKTNKLHTDKVFAVNT